MAKSNDELLSLLHGDQTDSTELIHIIQQHCGSTLQVDSLEIRYSPNCRGSHTSHDSYALRLLFSQNDKLLSIESGPSCTAELLTRLQEHVETALVKIGPTEVAARLLFSNQPLRGYYRYRDHFQLLPMPPETPQATGLGGDFPFRLEFEFHKSSDSVITSLRMERIARLGASI